MSRTVDQKLTIAAPPDVVWKALTDAEELSRWFPLDARVSPGKDGSIWMSWGEIYEEESTIEAWEPGEHLRLAFPVHGDQRLVTDYHLTAAGGSTVLRVVTSGFGDGEAWDRMFGGVQQGWTFELRGLKHYLERHRGAPRHVAWARVAFDGKPQDAWQRFTGPAGFFGPGIPPLNPGGPYGLTTKSGHTLSGAVLVYSPPWQFVGTVREWNEGLFRFEVEMHEAKGTVMVWLATWGGDAAKVAAVQEAWRKLLR